MQLFGHQLVGEASGEGRQVVGGDRAGDGDAHEVSSGGPAVAGAAGNNPPTVPAPAGCYRSVRLSSGRASA
ncbi:hypothetical protein Kpho02_52850 [Kitasatospora phosalacinea]|uniref:Uncharacterized protein n=1 Tax=Kitasatospora phosalacinea TaxID=2065 RepID=A0A9W6QCN4_9ACTN|nr:hypothetical protein Kpho02_52850 [Kitasatospora phosalacinea]